MCCFSRPVVHVSKTKIFARALVGGAQSLVYAMTMSAKEDLAMVLPLPVPPSPPEDAVRFVDLSGYEDFFAHVERAFPAPLTLVSGAMPSRMAPQPATLKVHDVGKFEASFVPSVAEFSRLDARFRLPPSTFEALPQYRDYGFAVFKLKKSGGLFAPKQQSIHPMAFVFPRRDATKVFFPTVHVHDGEVHATARFDHALYCQMENPPAGWEASDGALGDFVDSERARGLIDGAAPAQRKILLGELANADTIV